MKFMKKIYTPYWDADVFSEECGVFDNFFFSSKQELFKNIKKEIFRDKELKKAWSHLYYEFQDEFPEDDKDLEEFIDGMMHTHLIVREFNFVL